MVTMDCDGRWDGMGWGTVKRLHSAHRLESSTLTFWPVPMGVGGGWGLCNQLSLPPTAPTPSFLDAAISGQRLGHSEHGSNVDCIWLPELVNI